MSDKAPEKWYSTLNTRASNSFHYACAVLKIDADDTQAVVEAINNPRAFMKVRGVGKKVMQEIRDALGFVAPANPTLSRKFHASKCAAKVVAAMISELVHDIHAMKDLRDREFDGFQLNGRCDPRGDGYSGYLWIEFHSKNTPDQTKP